MLAGVKADAYGHGSGKVGRFLQRAGSERLAVATTVEALALRDAGLRLPVHILAPVPCADYQHVAGEDFVFTIGSAAEVEALAVAARRAGSREVVHLEIATGMGRSGCRPAEAERLVRLILSKPTLLLEGAMTHFPSADDPADPEGAAFARGQVSELERLGRVMRELGVPAPVLHAANSAGVAFVSESALGFVRPGGALYGLSSGPRTADALGVRPALAWRATVVQVRAFSPGETVGYGRAFTVEEPSVIATVAVGYGDGYARAYGSGSLSGAGGAGRKLPGGSVLGRGERAPVVGRVSMDSTTVDVTRIRGVACGDEVMLLGVEGDDEISAGELASRAETSPYEVTCRITRRVPRFYRSGRD